MDLIKITDVSFSYSHGIPVLSDLSLTIASGDYAVLLGENGTGKSTLLKVILGELTAQSGTVSILGHTGRQAIKACRIGYVAQNSTAAYQNFPATVEEIVATGLYGEIKKGPFFMRKARPRIAEALQLLDVEEYKKALFSHLSGGLMQRVMLARALICDPSILLLDEPTNGVDAHSIETLYTTLDRLHASMGLTILMVTHGSYKNCRGVNRVLRFEEGKVEEA
ncbi:MAG: metal ABC transporter ATP-binding protein [Lachnospiraceae bacterium]